jgi:hypothetical protein
LDRLRAALADVPRPLGLIPASPRQRAGSRQTHTAPTAIARQPVPAASLPVPLTALPATTTPTGDTLPAESLAETSLTEELPADGFETGSETAGTLALVDHGSTTEPAASHEAPAALEADSASTTPDAKDHLVDADAPGNGADAIGALPASLASVPEASTEVAASADPVAAVDSATTTIDSSATPAADPAMPPAAEVTATPAPQQTRTTQHAQSRRHGGGQRPSASRSPQQPMTPLDRLQARLEQMPRALGLVPAPRPSMHANRAPQRRTAPPAPAAASLPSVAAESTPATTAPTQPAQADHDTVASDEAGEAPQAPMTNESDVAVPSPAAAGTIGDEGSSQPTVPTPDEPALVTDAEIEQDNLAVVDGEGEATICSPATDAESIEEEVDAVSATASPDEPALVAATVEESVMPAPAAESMPVAGMPSAVVAKRPATRQPASQPAAPMVRRPIRDALGTALANMPRPFGLLPEPEAVPRRSAASPAQGPAAPRALATKSIGTRPLDAGTKAQSGNALAIVAAPPALPQSADDGTTLTSGNHAENAEMPATIADGATEPAPLDVDLPEGASEAEALEAAPASVEVTVECPEETTTLGERVTLLLKIRNTGTAPVCSVTPVVHFGTGLEPLGIRGRNGYFSADGSVMFDRFAEIPAGECVELEIVAVCTGTGTIPYRGVAWCGDGEDREIVPADNSVTVTPSAMAAEPTSVRHR